MLPSTPISCDTIINTWSETVDLNYWFKAEQRPPFMLCFTKYLINTSL